MFQLHYWSNKITGSMISNFLIVWLNYWDKGPWRLKYSGWDMMRIWEQWFLEREALSNWISAKGWWDGNWWLMKLIYWSIIGQLLMDTHLNFLQPFLWRIGPPFAKATDCMTYTVFRHLSMAIYPSLCCPHFDDLL